MSQDDAHYDLNHHTSQPGPLRPPDLALRSQPSTPAGVAGIERVRAAAACASPEVAEALDGRLARAQWVGLVYHGTKTAFGDFDLAAAGATDPGLAGPALYFAPDPGQASVFAESPHYGVQPPHRRRAATGPSAADAAANQPSREALLGAPPGAAHRAPQVIPVLVVLDHPAWVVDGVAPDGRGMSEIHGGGITRAAGHAWQRALKAVGHDGVVFHTAAGEVTQVAVFAPHHVIPALAPAASTAWRHGDRTPAPAPTAASRRRL